MDTADLIEKAKIQSVLTKTQDFSTSKVFGRTISQLMNDINPSKKQDIICHCSGTTKTLIKELLDQGINNLDRISRITGACSGCGACDTSILELLAEYAPK